MTIEKLIEEYLTHIYVVEQKSANTRDSYRRELVKYRDFLTKEELDLADVDNQVLTAYLIDLSNKNYKSLNHALGSLRSFHNYLNFYHSELEIVSVQIKGQKGSKHLPDFLSLEDVNKLLNNCDDILEKAVLMTLYATGMRVSELVGLRLNSVNLEYGFLRCLGKRNKERIIPIFEKAVDCLKEYLIFRENCANSVNNPHFFLNKKGRPLTRQYVFLLVKRNCQKSGLSPEVSPHSLRHTFASLLLDNGADLRSIQELLGHSDISTTQIYTHLQTKKLKSAYDQYHPGNKLRDDVEE